jgi:hypothetical protein
MSPAVLFHARPFVLLLPALLGCVGCDLGDYERNLDETRIRVAYFDNENKVLADPINLPRHKVPVVFTNKKGKPDKKLEFNVLHKLDVFLRPPKGYPIQQTKDDEKNPYNNVLYRYAARGNSIYNLFLAATTDKRKSTDEFHAEVRQSLTQFYQKEYKRGITFAPQKTVSDRHQPLKTGREQAAPIFFQKASYSDGRKEDSVQFEVYFFKSGSDQVAIVFEMPTGEAPRWDGALDYSLKTFDIRAGAANKRREYLSRGG